MKTLISSFVKSLLICCLGLSLSLSAIAQIEIIGQSTPEELVGALLNMGIEVTNIELNCPDTSYGIFTAESDVGIGLSQGIVLTSGSIDDIPGPNSDQGISFPSGGGSDPFLDELLEDTGVPSMDACVLQIDLVPCGEILSFNYVFASDEYNEFACSNFNDIFAFLISGPDPDGGDYVNENIALIPGTSLPVAINTVNIGVAGGSGGGTDCVLDYAEFYVDNDSGNANIEYDGFTVPLTAFASVVPDSTYTLYLAIADASDSSWDSGVFIEAGSLTAQFIDIVIEPSVEIDGIDNLVEGCIDGLINFETSAPASEDIIIEYTLSGSAENGVDYGMPNGDPLGGIVLIPTGSSSASVELVVYTDGVSEGIEDIIISIQDQTDCDDTPVSVSLSIQDELTLDACCDAVITAGESVDISVTGGSGTYTWSPDDGTIDDATSANPTVTPTQTTTYTVTSSIGDCELVGSVTITIGGCDSDAGTVSGGGVICAGSNVSAVASGQVLDGDDVLVYVLHNSSTSNINDPDFEAYDFNATGVFTNDGDAPTNETIYISSVVGSDDGDGLPDGDDPCLSLSPPVEVVFLDPVMVNVQEICDGGTGELSVEINGSGGLPEYNQSGSYTISGTGLTSATAEFGLNINVGLGEITGQTYSYTASDINGCVGSFTSGPVECVKTAVELSVFNGNVTAKSNYIYWTTSSETDNDFFTLQRSFDGLVFEDIATIDGAGNSISAINYSYNDFEIREGYHYYRLKATEFSGISSWSDVILLKREVQEAATIFDIYPVPAIDELIVQLDDATISGQINVFDLSGKYLLGQDVDLTEGVNQVKLNISELSPGLYMLTWETSNGIEVQRFVKE